MLPFAVGVVGSGYTGLDSSPYGVASRPVVYRVLIPSIAKMVRSIIPETIEHPLTDQMIHWRDSEEGRDMVKAWFIRPPPLADDKIFETAVVACVSYLTLLAFIWIFYTLTLALFPESRAYAFLAPLIALQLLPALTVENGYIYDFAELFFSCALFYLLLKQRWRLYMLTFVFATLNKETTIFSIFFYTMWFYSRLPRKQYFARLLQQCMIYALVKGGINLYFADKPGVVAQHHFLGQLDYASQHLLGIGLSAIVLLWIVFYRWQQKPLFLRGGLWMLLPNLVLFIIICIPGEFRDFYWSLPVMIIMATHSLLSYAGFADHPVFKNAKESWQ